MRIEDILKVVAKHYAITVEDILSIKRDDQAVQSRRVAMYVARKRLGKAVPEISAAFGKSHAVVVHSIMQVEKLLANDASLEADVERLCKELMACKCVPELISAPALQELVCVDKNSDDKFTVHVNGDPDHITVEVITNGNETTINIWPR